MKFRSKKFTFQATTATLGILIILVMVGCSVFTPPTQVPTQVPIPTEPPATQVPPDCKSMRFANTVGMALLNLPDGSQVFMNSDTEFDFIPGNYCPDRPAHQVILLKGEIAIHSILPQDILFAVFSPEGYKITLNETALVRYDQAGKRLAVYCSNGFCTLGTDAQPVLITCGQMAELDQAGNLSGPFVIDVSVLQPYGEWLLPRCGNFTTSTPAEDTPSYDFGATATAACSAWNNQFPSTPCPTMNP